MPKKTTLKKECNLVAPLNQLGFGIFSIIYYKYLLEESFVVNWELIGTLDESVLSIVAKDYDISAEAIKKAINRPLSPDCKTLTIWHPHQLNRCKIGSKSIGITHFETTILKPDEVAAMSELDEVYVCSKWGEDILKAHGISNSGVCPGVAAPVEISYSEILSKAYDSSVRLQNVFTNRHKDKDYIDILCSAGKWESRKDQKIFIEALEAIDTKNEPIAVLAFWNNVFTGGLQEPYNYLLARDWEMLSQIEHADGFGQLIKHKTKDIQICLMPFVKTQTEMLGYMMACQMFISVSKGEGWDQPLVDAMELGKLCIATYNTAHKEYLTPENAILIPCREELAKDDKWFHGDRGNWFPANGIEEISNALEFGLKLVREEGIKTTNDKIEVCEAASLTIRNIVKETGRFLNKVMI